jgi:hypothetical protein
MPHPLTLPALGIAALAGAAVGVYLGEQSVAEINPFYFQGPAIHPRDRGAAVAEWEPQPQPPSFAALYGWAQGRAARAEDCGDCMAAVAPASTWSPEPSAPETLVAPPPAKPAKRAAEPVKEPADRAATLAYDFERYAYYPVTAEEADHGDAWASYE